MTKTIDDRHGAVMSFAEDLLHEYRARGHDPATLFLALTHLLAMHDVEKAGNALCCIDDVVMSAPRRKRCRKTQPL